MDRPYSKLEKIEEPVIFLATPTGKDKNMNIETATFCSYTSCLPDVRWGYTSTMSPEMSRNTLIEDHEFRKQEFTHVFFVDSDTVPPNDALEILIGADADVIVGIYPIIVKGLCWSIARENEDWIPMYENLSREPFEIASSGAGCLLVRKEVLDDIGWPYFKMEYQPKWENGGEATKNGEDEYFCRKVTAKGYKIMADPFVICKHYNNVDLLKVLSLAREIFRKEEI